jgi:long-chain acyl-CoA synthetase
MTEASGIVCVNISDLINDLGTIGIPLTCVETKLIDIPDVGYFTSNNPPRGELCIRGPSVVRGYFKRPDLNSDPTIFTPDGWFRTGDIGQFNPDGTLSIIDR